MNQRQLSDNTLARQFPNVEFGHGVQILGLANTRIGAGSVVGVNSWINVCDRDHKVRLVIGRRVLIGRQNLISAGGTLEIGDHCLFAPNVFVSDTDHVVANITRPYVDQGFTAGRVVVEENCWLGIHAVVSGDITVGRGSVVAANAVVTRDVPPFSIVAGVPAKIIKMFNPKTNTWEPAVDRVQQQSILEARENTPLPSRDEYRFILQRTANNKSLSPLLAGREMHI